LNGNKYNLNRYEEIKGYNLIIYDVPQKTIIKNKNVPKKQILILVRGDCYIDILSY
jgi:hypothetical protein